MSIRRQQTHSGVILHVLRPTEQDTEVLQSEYGVHPLDTSAMLEVQNHAEASRYQHDNRLQLCLPWVVDGRLVSTDIAFIWNERQIILVHDTPDRMIAATMHEIETVAEYSTNDIVSMLLLAITEKVESFGVNIHPEVRSVLQENWKAIERMLELMERAEMQDHIASWKLAIHRLKHIERLSMQPVAVSPVSYAQHAPRTAMRFAAASVLLFVSVLWALH